MENTVFYFQECEFTGPLRSNGCPTVACACVAGMCLPNRRLAMGIHVTILLFSFCFSVSTSCFQYSVISCLCYVVSLWRGTIVSCLKSMFCPTWYCVTSVNGGRLLGFLNSMLWKLVCQLFAAGCSYNVPNSSSHYGTQSSNKRIYCKYYCIQR
jgi:hypothetical protein